MYDLLGAGMFCPAVSTRANIHRNRLHSLRIKSTGISHGDTTNASELVVLCKAIVSPSSATGATTHSQATDQRDVTR